MDKLKRLVARCKENPMLLAFVLDAVAKQADTVLDCPADKWPKHCIVTLACWQEAAARAKLLIS